MATRQDKAEVLRLSSFGRHDGVRLGRIVEFAHGVTRVDFEGNGQGPVVARVAADVSDAALEEAARDRREAVLIFAGSDSREPIVLALLRSATPQIDDALSAAASAGRKIAHVDGHRVEIEGHDEVVLRCGKASLTLRRDGRVVLRGVNVVSQADQVQKIRGGKVQIN